MGNVVHESSLDTIFSFQMLLYLDLLELLTRGVVAFISLQRGT